MQLLAALYWPSCLPASADCPLRSGSCNVVGARRRCDRVAQFLVPARGRQDVWIVRPTSCATTLRSMCFSAPQPLAGRAGQRAAANSPRLGGVVAQEVDRLAHFEHRVDQRLARLALAQADELGRCASNRSAACSRNAARSLPPSAPRPTVHFSAPSSMKIDIARERRRANRHTSPLSCGERISSAPPTCRPAPRDGRPPAACQRRQLASSGSRTVGSARSTPALFRRPG